ncbi:Crp/Fnr family transcriptional regulator [Streptomyces davaonensis]|uniref:Crp/Fnr family transcriptional regulator n=1 Tax=Streptomyces davaonensis TaxID=348043 RepID=UPI00059EEA81|nr:Crp/Fnr family transcriptional regulator [Streptomyces davaonensis]
MRVRSFLGELSPGARGALARYGTRFSFPRGSFLISEGALDSDVFVLLSSYVKVTASLTDGGWTLVAVRMSGDLVGELAGMSGAPRSASVIACGCEPVTALRLSWGEFEQVKAEHPEVLARLQESVSRKLAAATRRRVDYRRRSPTVRLARVLVEMADDFGQSVRGREVILPMDLKHLEWGELIGVSESTAYRALRELRDLVDAHHRRVIVMDLTGLRAVADRE